MSRYCINCGSEVFSSVGYNCGKCSGIIDALKAELTAARAENKALREITIDKMMFDHEIFGGTKTRAEAEAALGAAVKKEGGVS